MLIASPSRVAPARTTQARPVHQATTVIAMAREQAARTNSSDLPAQPTDPPLLSLRAIHKKFGGTYALQDVSFDVSKGEVLALLGENGAGKSTLIKTLAGVHTLDAGEILFEGQHANRHVADLPIAFIHQDLGLVDWMTVAENVCMTRGYGRSAGPSSPLSPLRARSPLRP